MSAKFDRSQGFSFVYTNIYSLYKIAKDSKVEGESTEIPSAVKRANVYKYEQIQRGQIKVEDYKPKELIVDSQAQKILPVPAGVREAEERALRSTLRPLGRLKTELQSLQDAQEKLHFLLKEIHHLTKKK